MASEDIRKLREALTIIEEVLKGMEVDAKAREDKHCREFDEARYEYKKARRRSYV